MVNIRADIRKIRAADSGGVQVDAKVGPTHDFSRPPHGVFGVPLNGIHKKIDELFSFHLFANLQIEGVQRGKPGTRVDLGLHAFDRYFGKRDPFPPANEWTLDRPLFARRRSHGDRG